MIKLGHVGCDGEGVRMPGSHDIINIQERKDAQVFLSQAECQGAVAENILIHIWIIIIYRSQFFDHRKIQDDLQSDPSPSLIFVM